MASDIMGDVAALEQLVISRSLAAFTPGAESHYYFTLLAQLQHPLTPAFSQQLEKFSSAFPGSYLVKTLCLRYLLKQIDEATEHQHKQELLAQLNDAYLKLNFDAPVPTASAVAIYPSALDPAVLTLDHGKAVQDVNYFRSLSLQERHQLDIDLMSKAVFEEFLSGSIIHVHPAVVPRIARDFEKHPGILPSLYKLTLQQIEQLADLCPALKDNEGVVGSLFERQFVLKENASHSEKESTLNKALEWSSQLSPKFRSYRKQLIFDLLQLRANKGVYDEALLIEYLAIHGKGSHFLTQEEYREVRVPISLFDRNTDKDLIDRLLEQILARKENTSEFSPYLSSDYLARSFAKAKILSGSDPTSFSLPSAHLEELAQLVTLELAADNPQAFNRSSDVALRLYTKNVPKLIVQVFELDPLAYSLAHGTSIPDTLSFDGLEPTHQQVLDYSSDSPFVKSLRTIQVPTAVAGLFAVEFFGNGQHARALIKKGHLKLVSKVTAAGHQMTVLNEDNAVCTGKGAGIYVNSRFFELKEEKKSVMVPFSGSEHSNVAVITDGVVCDTVTFLHRAESYKLKCGFIIMEESLQAGATASIGVAPRLFVSGLPGPKELMKEASVVVVTVDLDGISSSKKFQQLAVDELLTLDFEVPTKAASVQVTFSCEVTPLTSSTPIPLTATRTFAISQTSRVMSAKQLFLRRSAGEFYVQVLGKNGEPCAKVVVAVQCIIHATRTSLETLLLSNGKGLIALGTLETVTNVTAMVMEDGSKTEVRNAWNLDCFRPSVQYPKVLILCEGDSFGLPFMRKGNKEAPLSASEVELREYSGSGILISASSNQLTFDSTSETLVLTGLSEGHYMIVFGTGEEVLLEVEKGTHWGNNQYILTETQVIQTYKQYRSLMVTSAERSENMLTVKLAGDYQNAVVHILLHSFLAGSVKETYTKLAELTAGRPSDAVKNPDRSSRYVKSRTLDEEYRYVLERKLQEKFTGNSLPKPQLLLKPSCTETATSQAEGDAFRDAFPESMAASNMRMMKRSAAARSSSTLAQSEVSNSMDFLLTPAVMKLSCPVGENGAVVISLPEGEFSHASVIAANSDSTAFLTADLQSLSLNTKDLALRLILNLAKTYAETRKCSVLRTGDELAIADMASASLQVVDSVDKLSQLLVQLSKLLSSGLDVQEWDFLGRWHLLSAEEKNKKYDKYCSHELNLFLYTKDPQYFTEVVRPFIAAKMEKTLVDDYLLGDSLEKYLESVTSLNCLEKVLLVQRNEHARGLISTLSKQAKAIPRDEIAEQKMFDAVLKFSIEGAEKDELSQFFADQQKAAQEEALQYRPMEDPFLEMKSADMPEEMSFAMSASIDSVSELRMQRDMAPPPMAPARGVFASLQRIPEMSKACSMTRSSAKSEKRRIMVGMAPPSQSISHKSVFLSCGSAMSREEAEMNLAVEDNECFGDALDSDLLEAREEQRPYFQQMDSTKEYAETHYYGLKDPSEFSLRVQISVFLAELAEAAASGKHSVLSQSVLHMTANLTTYVVALAFTDLPLRAEKHGFQSHGIGVRIKASSNCLAFHKNMDEVATALQDNVLCTQRYFHPKDRYVTNAAGEKEEKPVKEFVAGVVYGSQVIVTNVSVAGLPAHVLVQVPEGSMPVTSLDYTKSHLMLLSAYQTKTLEYFFYFPAPGQYVQAPINVSVGGEVISASAPFKFTVVAEKSLLSSDSLKDITTTGDMDLAISFLQSHSPHTPDVYSQLNSLLWMLRDLTKYSKLVSALHDLQCFHRGIWSYSVLHCDEVALRELLASEDSFKQTAGYFLDSSLLKTGLLHYRHLDYSPMVNARAYRLASQPRIAIEQFKNTYEKFLFMLAHKPELDTADFLGLIEYLLYQDRVPEAKRLLSNVKLQPSEGAPGNTPLQLQFDYLMCYLDSDVAQRVAPLYLNYPIPAWNALFEQVRKQFVDEKEECVTESLATSLSFTVQKGIVKLLYAGISHVYIRLYEVDLEVLFSRNPFFMKDTELFTYVCPNEIFSVDLDPRAGVHEFPLDEKWTSVNIFVEVEYDGKKLFQAHFSSRLTVNVVEQYGLVQVLDETGHGVSRTYVKVFSKENSGQTTFYKDGYTDVRGKFDYVSLNTNQLERVESFAMLVTHDSLGATIVTVKPPPK